MKAGGSVGCVQFKMTDIYTKTVTYKRRMGKRQPGESLIRTGLNFKGNYCKMPAPLVDLLDIKKNVSRPSK